MIVPRPGVAAEVEIGLVGAGDIEGVLVQDDGSGIEGLEIELLDATGNVVATTQSDFDGFFLFERVAYGRYSLRLAEESAQAVGVDRAIDATAEISPERTVIRLGVIRTQKRAQIASMGSGSSAIGSPH